MDLRSVDLAAVARLGDQVANRSFCFGYRYTRRQNSSECPPTTRGRARARSRSRPPNPGTRPVAPRSVPCRPTRVHDPQRMRMSSAHRMLAGRVGRGAGPTWLPARLGAPDRLTSCGGISRSSLTYPVGFLRSAHPRRDRDPQHAPTSCAPTVLRRFFERVTPDLGTTGPRDREDIVVGSESGEVRRRSRFPEGIARRPCRAWNRDSPGTGPVRWPRMATLRMFASPAREACRHRSSRACRRDRR